MKSMLHEASSVAKAIEKAWADSGKPLEFTITVLEVGEKNFLGFTKRPAVISITYDPKKQVVRQAEKKAVSNVYKKPARQHPQQPAKPKVEQKVEPKVRRTEFKTEKAVYDKPRPARPVEEREEQELFWTADLIADVNVNLKEMLDHLGVTMSFELKEEQRMLRIILEKNVHESAEEERHLYVGLSYLLIQFLKKKYKKKLRGYHLVISSKTHATPAPQRPSSFNA